MDKAVAPGLLNVTKRAAAPKAAASKPKAQEVIEISPDAEQVKENKKPEKEIEMESQIESKNFEVARLMDRLNYYEAVNREISQRDQGAIELARRDRQRKRKMQKWMWGSVATTITPGSATLVWSYLPGDKGSGPSPNHFSARDSEIQPDNRVYPIRRRTRDEDPGAVVTC